MDTNPSFNQEVFSAESYRDLLEQIGQPLFLLKDAGVPTKNFIDWRHAGLWFDKGSEKRTWTRLDLEQYIWLKIIQQMRQLGFPTKLILQVKTQLLAPVDLEESLVKYRDTILDNLHKMDLDPDDKEAYRQELMSGSFLKNLQDQPEAKQFLSSQSMLKSHIMRALSTRQQAAVLIYPNGLITIWLDEMYLLDSRSPDLFATTHLYISITEMLNELVVKKQEMIRPFRLLNNEEWQVLTALQDNTLKELKVTFNKDTKTKKLSKSLITTKDGEVSREDESKAAKILMDKKYNNVKHENRPGNRIYYSRDFEKNI